jgi:TolA-binding protein
MSAASTPAPSRHKSVVSASSRHTLFWPVLIFLIGSGTFTIYQVISLEDQLDEVTRSVDQMDAKVRRAQYEKAKFFAIAKDVLRLAPKDPNAEKIVVEFKIRQLQTAQPVLMALSTPQNQAATNSGPASPNAAPMRPSAATNAAPLQPAGTTNVESGYPLSPGLK